MPDLWVSSARMHAWPELRTLRMFARATAYHKVLNALHGLSTDCRDLASSPDRDVFDRERAEALEVVKGE